MIGGLFGCERLNRCEFIRYERFLARLASGFAGNDNHPPSALTRLVNDPEKVGASIWQKGIDRFHKGFLEE
jgi:hypothetical protein